MTVGEGGRELRWSEESRLRAIDATAFWEGRINRSDLIRRFGISVPQATNDLREYQARTQGNLRYDPREKAYLTEPGFKPLFGPPSAEAWLAAGETGAGMTVPVAAAPVPVRQIDPWLLRRFLNAHRARRALRVLYQSMDEPDAAWCWVTPRALGSDGFRWHVRAWNHDTARHADLLFPRVLQVDGERPSGDLPADTAWDRVVEVRLRPAIRLSPGQRHVVELDYGMRDSEVVIPVRAALLFLFLRRQGLDRPGGLVEVANHDEVKAELAVIEATFRLGKSGTTVPQG